MSHLKWIVAAVVLVMVLIVSCCGPGHAVGTCALEGAAFGLVLGLLVVATQPAVLAHPWRVVVIVRTHMNAATAVGLLTGLGKAAVVLVAG